MKAILTALAAALMLTAGSSSVAGPQLETAVLAGGCYWGMDSVYEHVKGVRGVISGWAGGNDGLIHAEAVQIRFDPSQISYQQLLQIYFTVAHDPTQVNRQGPDVGVNYRSAIFPQTPQQEAIASQMIAKLQAAHAYPRPIATRIEKGPFHAAPLDQQDFAEKNPDLPYIVINDKPKLARLKQDYPQWWKA
jgi:peptide-methionine (S)-S-oxide reductase